MAGLTPLDRDRSALVAIIRERKQFLQRVVPLFYGLAKEFGERGELSKFDRFFVKVEESDQNGVLVTSLEVRVNQEKLLHLSWQGVFDARKLDDARDLLKFPKEGHEMKETRRLADTWKLIADRERVTALNAARAEEARTKRAEEVAAAQEKRKVNRKQKAADLAALSQIAQRYGMP